MLLQIKRNFFLLRNREYSCNVKPLLLATDFFTETRKVSLMQRVAKLRMAKPISRRVVDESRLHELNRASVLVPLVSINNEPALLLSSRSSSLRSHGGEMCFPGGKFDTLQDKTALDTALRETEEELGINKMLFQIWAQLPTLRGRDRNLAITPIIAFLKEPLVLSNLGLNHDEVSSVHVCTITELCQAYNQAFTQFGAGYTLPVYYGRNTNPNAIPRIWGLTAIIIHITLNALVPEMYRFNLPFIPRIPQLSNKI